MREMKNKIKSRRGASITFALLLFLVCAVLSSVIIVAGTAAAGRMKDLPEMDQRYYSVISAGEFLRDIFGRVESVTVEYLKSGNAAGNPIPVVSRIRTVTVKYDKSNGNTMDDPAPFKTLNSDTPTSFDEILALASCALIEPSNPDENGNLLSKDYTIEPSVELLNAFPGVTLKCAIKETLGTDGLLVFEVSSVDNGGASSGDTGSGAGTADASSSAKSYKLKVVFASNVKQIPLDENLNTAKAEITWTLHSIEKQRVEISTT